MHVLLILAVAAVLFIALRRYVHMKSGNIYIKLFTTNKHSGKPGFPPTAVYIRARTGTIYSRPLSEFNEKFRKV